MHAIDHAVANLVDPLLVEGHDYRRHGAVAIDEVVHEQRLAKGVAAYRGGLLVGHGASLDQRRHLDPAVVSFGGRYRPDDVGRCEAADALDQLDLLEVAGHTLDELQTLGREDSVALEGDDERARPAELLAEALVGLVLGIVLCDPRAQIVVDGGEIRLRRKEKGAPQDADHEEKPVAVEELRDRER